MDQYLLSTETTILDDKNGAVFTASYATTVPLKLGVWLGCKVPACFVCTRPRFKPQAFGKLKHRFYLWNISKVIIPVRMYILFCHFPLAFCNKILPNAEVDTFSI